VNLLFIINNLTTGGAEIQLKNIIISHKNKTDIKVISIISKGEIGFEIQRLGVDVYELKMKNIFYVPLGIIKMIYYFFKIRPDVVHSWMYHSNLFSSIFCKLFRVKNVIWSIHQFDTSLKFNSFATVLIIKIGALLSKFVPNTIICVSEQVKINHIKFGYCREKCKVISNGIDTNNFSINSDSRTKTRKKLDIDSNTILIGLFARYHPIKGHLNFLHSIKLLEQKNSINSFAILLVGLNCDNNNLDLINTIKNIDLKSNVKLLGLRTDIPELLSSLDLFVSASENEAFSLALAEAMSCGIPCVSTKAGDPSSLLSQYGFICIDNKPVNLCNSISDAIIKMNNQVEWECRKLGCSEYINNNFSIQKVLHDYEEIWNK
jgi:glycosyltransferase involved in cell wall biosynthesis